MKTSSPSISPFSRSDSMASVSFLFHVRLRLALLFPQWRDSQNQRVCVFHSPEFRPSIWWLLFCFLISTSITFILSPIQRKHTSPSCFPFSHNVSLLSKDRQHPPVRTYIPNDHAYMQPITSTLMLSRNYKH